MRLIARASRRYRMGAAVLLIAVGAVGAFTAPHPLRRDAPATRRDSSHLPSTNAEETARDGGETTPATTYSNRRGFLAAAISSASALRSFASAAPAKAASGGGGGDADAGVSPKDLLVRMRRVPTFVIVDGDTGAPYMIADKGGGGATGYFFAAFRGATFVLDEARRVAERDGYEEVWANATIITVPLDIAMRLAFKKLPRKGQNDLTLDTICDIIPSAEAIDEALKYDKSGRYKQQGSVPLFYIEGLELPAEEGEKRMPVYFTKSDLMREWNKQNPGDPSPDVKVMNLIDTFQATMRPGGGSGLLKKIVFIPPEEAVKVAKELKSQQSVPSYKMGEMLAVGGK